MRQLKWLLGVFICIPVFSYTTPDRIREKYSYLYQLEPQTQEDGSVVFHQARLFRRDGLSVLSLNGDRFEMAFQHGTLLKKEILQGALPQVAKIVDNSIKNTLPQIPLLTELIIKYLYRNETDKILEYSIESMGGDRDYFMSDAYGISEATGMSLDDVLHAMNGPESLQVLLEKKIRGDLFFGDVPQGAALNECTDFAAKGSYTATGNILIGRNTDYPLNGFFDRFPTVLYYHPTDGSLNHMAITSAGLHTAGVVGYNEAGLFLGVHTIPTLEVSEKGNSIFFVGQYVLQQARTFDEAIEIFRQFRPAAGWTYTLVSAREKRSASIEMTNQKISIRETVDDLHVQTNHFVTNKMLKANLDLNATVNEDTRSRMARVQEIANQRMGTLDIQDAVDILSDKWDTVHKEIRGMGNVVSVHSTLSSSIFDPAHGRAFVASGLAPVSTTPFIEVPLVENFNPDLFSSESYSTYQNDTYASQYPAKAQAEQLYIRAKTAYETELNVNKSLSVLKQVVSVDPSNAAYHFVMGIMALKAGKVSVAESAFRKCEQLKYTHYRLASQYYLGRIYADRGDKVKAQKKFEQVLQNANPELEAPLIKACEEAYLDNEGPLPLKLKPRSLALFMPEADMISY